MSPTHPVLTLPPEKWPADWRDAYEERAAIMQHHGGLSAAVARIKAAGLLRDEYRKRARDARSSVSARKVASDAHSQEGSCR